MRWAAVLALAAGLTTISTEASALECRQNIEQTALDRATVVVEGQITQVKGGLSEPSASGTAQRGPPPASPGAGCAGCAVTGTRRGSTWIVLVLVLALFLLALGRRGLARGRRVGCCG